MTPTTELLQDLLAHLLWADAQIWKHVKSAAVGMDTSDLAELKERLHHLHGVQKVFAERILSGASEWRGNEEFPALSDVEELRRIAHAGLDDIRSGLNADMLDGRVHLPWLDDNDGQPSRMLASEALTQVALHTQHHRGQIFMRLRQLGADELKSVDYIYWVKLGRPS